MKIACDDRFPVEPWVTEAELRARLTAATVFTDADSDGDDTHGLNPPPYVPAAVLVPFVLGTTPGVLLTKRAGHLNKHAGQVSFPGGRIDPGDASPEAAALREAEEEIGLNPMRVELAGRLPDYVTATGYLITPVLGLLSPGIGLDGLGLTASPHEVEQVFELPLAVLMDPAAPSRKTRMWKGHMRGYWEWPHPEHHIWGATAAILVGLATRLRAAG
jgi:8-oxo-dGTP pyrophosphatase MutT (NUDIX family)